MTDYWVGVIIGACATVFFFTVMQFVTVEQNARLRQEVKELKETVSEHEEIMNYFGWLKNLKEKEEDLK